MILWIYLLPAGLRGRVIMWEGDRMKTISGIEFASEHNGTDVFRLIELAYEQGQKDGHSEQLGSNLAEVGTDAINRADAIKIVQNRCKRYTTACVLAVTEIRNLPPIQPKRETATVSVGKSRGGVTMWYECAACGELVDQGDTFCSRCGRRLIHE